MIHFMNERTINTDEIVLAILAKNKEKFLPLYLKCIEEQTYDPKKIHIYIRTNNNTDNTRNILMEWSKKMKNHYASLVLIDNDVSEKVEKYGEHEWNEERFKVLAKIRQDSIKYAISKKAHYFVIDCDNFIIPSTLEDLMKASKPVIAPMLKHPNSLYSNYHHCVSRNGYYIDCPDYNKLHSRENPGIHLCQVVHCTYLIKNEFLHLINYFDGSSDYEYVIFSRNCRLFKIEQYLDNRKEYGYLTLEDNDKCNIEHLEILMNDIN